MRILWETFDAYPRPRDLHVLEGMRDKVTDPTGSDAGS